MDQELKQRLIGASVIIALAVIFVPMLFDGEVEQKNNQNISISIPEEGDNNLEVKKFELDKPVAQSSGNVASGTSNNELPANEVELVVNNDQVQLIDKDQANQPIADNIAQTDGFVEETNSAAAEQLNSSNTVNDSDDESEVETQVDNSTAGLNNEVVEEPVQVNIQTKTPPTAKTSNQAYRVKLGSFSQQGNAEKVKSSLLQKNIKAIVEYNPGLKLYRVWSQQLYRDENQANAYVSAVDQLKLNIGKPKVVSLNADEVSQMAGQGQMGWVVQLGSFSAKDNAIELRNKVKAAGFSGFVDLITNSKGVQLYRLRIGPLMEKQDAVKAQNDIKQKLKIEGLVKAHDLGQIVD